MTDQIIKTMPSTPIYITAALLLLAVFSFPIGYYTLLRLIACGVFVWSAYIAYQKKTSVLMWCFAFTALIFNPVLEFALGRSLWVAVDFVSAIVLLASRSFLTTKENALGIEFPRTTKRRLLLGLLVFAILMLAGFMSQFAMQKYEKEDFFGVVFWAVLAFVSYWFGLRQRAV